MSHPTLQKTFKICARNFECPIFGEPQELSDRVLPTYQDIFKALLEERKKLIFQVNKEPSFKIIMESVILKVESIYKKLLIPIISHRTIQQKIKLYNNKYINIKKILHRSDRCLNTKLKVEVFKKDSLKLFEITACKCVSYVNCKCKKNRKIPASEIKFLEDQRSERKLAIGRINLNETKKLQKKIERKSRDMPKNQMDHAESSASNSCLQSPESEEIKCSPDSQDFFVLNEKSKETSNQIRVNLKNTAEVSTRYDVSDRAAAAIATAVLQDFGIVSELDTSNVIDKSKLRREKQKVSANLKRQRTENLRANPLLGLYFDGRHDNSRSKELRGSRLHSRIVKEDHYSIIQEPGSKYIGHVTPESGSAKSISVSIFSFISKNVPASLEMLQAVGCDGTVVNTGYKGGVIRKLELKCGRSLQWFVCLLHFNELPLKHLFEKVDGGTTGPTSHSGPIGKMLTNCENLPVTNFKSMNCSLPTIDKSELSTDQKYLFLICEAINSGSCSEEVANLNPGNLSNSRWLTKANRICRLYIATENPSFELKLMTQFVLTVYAPSWFRIKFNSSVKYGAKHLYSFIQSSRYLDDKYLHIIDPVIARNAYFASPENILLSMLTDDNKDTRLLALRKIINAKKQDLPIIREFKVPAINFSADSYVNLIDWEESVIHPPPVLKHFEENELQLMIDTDEVPTEWEFSKFPCHTQSVERTVKLVTEASAKVYGEENRDSHILTTLESRAKIPKFDTKKDYNV